jgi:hypothetical protein
MTSLANQLTTHQQVAIFRRKYVKVTLVRALFSQIIENVQII